MIRGDVEENIALKGFPSVLCQNVGLCWYSEEECPWAAVKQLPGKPGSEKILLGQSWKKMGGLLLFQRKPFLGERLESANVLRPKPFEQI